MRLDPPIALHAPLRAPGSERRDPARRSRSWVAALWLLMIAASCGRVAPMLPTPEPRAPATQIPMTARSEGTPSEAETRLDGLLVAAGGPLLVTDVGGNLVAFDPPVGPVSAVTAAAGEIVVTEPAGVAARLDSYAAAPAWVPVTLPRKPRAAVRLAAVAPSGSELAIVSGDPQGKALVVTVLDLGAGGSRTIPVDRGLNGPPSWLGPATIAVDVIRDGGRSGIATIDVSSGLVTDRPGPGTVVVSSIDGSRLAIDDPATGDVLIGDIASWEAGAIDTMRRIPGPPGTGIDGLAMSGDGSRLAVVRRSDVAGSIEILVRLGDDWRSVRILTRSGDVSFIAAWLD